MSDDKPNAPADDKRRLPAGAMVGVGIGSAAIVAALLYAGKRRTPKRREGDNG